MNCLHGNRSREYKVRDHGINGRFEEDGPLKNGFKFCPFCGRKIEEAK